jgi:hypothetical protein
MINLTWRDPTYVVHEVVRDAGVTAVDVYWGTKCGVVLHATKLGDCDDIDTVNCMACLGEAPGRVASCGRCRDTGYMDNGWNDFPCVCPAGNTAVFDVDGRITLGSTLKNEMHRWKRR